MSGFNNRPPLSQSLADNVVSNVSGVFSTRPTAKYASGARCLLKVNGKLCGFAFGVSWKINTQVIEVNTIDDYFAWELAPQRITVEGTISALHIPGTSIGTELWQPDILNFLWQEYISIEVRDSATDQLLFFTDKAMVTSRAEDIRVDSLANVQISWRAIGFRDERKPEPSTIETKTTGLIDNLVDTRIDPQALAGEKINEQIDSFNNQLESAGVADSVQIPNIEIA
jgi:hypothetical protein